MTERAAPAKRGSLSREMVITAALARVDRHGLDSLSMRELAHDLGVGAMSLYRHVHDKDELLELITDRVIDGFLPEPAEVPWPEQAARICRQVRAGLLAHPDLATHALRRPVNASATGLRVNGQMVAMLLGSGLPRDAAPNVYWVLSLYAMGFSQFEIERQRAVGGRPHHKSEERRRNLAALVAVFDVDVPDTDALAAVLSVDFGDEQFEFGLAAVILGLEASVGR